MRVLLTGMLTADVSRRFRTHLATAGVGGATLVALIGSIQDKAV